MDLHLLNTVIIVLGDKHNPTIINQDFLAIQEIVPKEWKWKTVDEGLLTSPQLARVPYKNGVVIHVEPNKAQISDEFSDNPSMSKIPEITVKFVHTLRHVRYKAVGINFHGFLEHKEPETFIKEHFLKKGEWDNKQNPVRAVGVRLLYKIEHGMLNLSIDPGQARTRGNESLKTRPVILISGNFHRGCTEYPADKQIHDFIEYLKRDWELFKSLTEKLLK